MSSVDNGAFIELTSSPCSPPHSATRGGPAVVSTVELSDPSLGLAGVRASLSALQQSIDQVETLRELRSDHELTDAANAASPYVLFCQYKYDVVRYKLESTWTELAECMTALQEAPLQRSSVHDRISILEAQLAVASSFGVIVPPDTARRIADLESQLARSQSDLQVARDRQSALVLELRESAMSHKAAQAEVVRLEAAIEHKTCRLRILRVNYERRLRVADTTIATHSTELNRLQDRVSTLDRDLQKASQRAQAAISQRDQARAERVATQDRVSAARDTIARLEKRINQVEKSQKSRQDLELALATLRQERDSLVVQTDELLGQLGRAYHGGHRSTGRTGPGAGEIVQHCVPSPFRAEPQTRTL
ncbi:hypothetical protein L917_21443 [Phytophthora nicotianae]|uniref:Uncharacterized protein n=1 Tax=Phytophthora nicotianae TaxID=4792 RepID=W2JZP4_PHYNI|nr:hypothetical protein L917_21443 [Phytophthora nicotianae]